MTALPASRAVAASDGARAPATLDVRAPRFACVLLTWNGCADTLACLQSLAPQLDDGDIVFVVDNGSLDGTEAEVRARFPWVHYVQNGANLGFAGGCNRGLARALADGAPWVLLLNTDTTLEPRALAELRAQAQACAPNVGVLQALLVRADDPAVVDSAGHAPTWLPGARELHAGGAAAALGSEPRPIFGACAAAVLVRREMLRDVGLFDEALFVLLEDVDLMFRSRCAGYEALLVPTARVRHRRGVSRGRPTRAARRLRKFWVQRNAVALALRYWPWPALGCAMPVLAWRVAQALWCGREPGACCALWRAAWRARPAARAGMRAHGVDRWLGGRR